jgi:tRNA 2-thiocytidine biosynthesis protein TtcA
MTPVGTPDALLETGAVDRQDAERRLLGLVGRAMGRFAMLRAGDRVAVGVSGGKDSLCLLHALVAHRRRSPVAYDLVAVTVEQGKFRGDIRALARPIRELGVEWVLREDAATLRLVAGGVAHGCDVCSRHRRRSLYHVASELGCTVLALGHTADDCAESLLRNILFNGRIASLPPVSTSRKGGLRLIRPLVYVSEEVTAAFARAAGLLPVGCVCGDKESVRREIRDFLAALGRRHGGVPESIAAALANVNPYTLFDPGLRKDGADPSPADSDDGGPRPGPPSPPALAHGPGDPGRGSRTRLVDGLD